MHIHLLAVGTRMPAWADAAYSEFARRLPPECRLRLTEIAPGPRSKAGDAVRAMAVEAERLRAALPKNARVIALEQGGRECTSEDLAQQLQRWLQDGRDVVLLIGGPDGLSADIRERAESALSLSRMTLPHALARVVIAEQLYRAWSILKNHPYHRA